MGRIDAGKSGEWRGPASRRLRWAPLAIVAALVIVLVVSFGVSGCAFSFGGNSTTTSSSGSAAKTTTTSGGADTIGSTNTSAGAGTIVTAGDGLASPAEAVGTALGPSVVNLAVKGGTIQGPFGSSGQYAAEGSGVIYTADGMIITNNHMVTDENGDPVTDITVTLATGEKLTGTIVGRDPLTDLAVVKVKPNGKLPVATFITQMPKVGEYAVAIGSPLGYENSVTLGIVSGLNRTIEGVTGTEGVALNNLIQTDAPISPGNSGGALANGSAQVIGINVAYESPTSGAVNIGFAIPSVVVTKVADEIISTGKATHAYMGVGTQTVTPEFQQQYGLSRSSGILVAEVTANGPAAKGGIKQGDIILKIDGKDMAASSDLLVSIRDKKPGDTVQVLLDRKGQEMTLTVTLEERPANLSSAAAAG